MNGHDVTHDALARRPLLVLVSGSPGTGKSTMAELIATECTGAIASFDWVMSALRSDSDTWAAVETPVERQRRTGWTLLARVAEQQLRIAATCVVDVVAHETYRRELAELAAQHGSHLAVVECVCSDESLHERRVSGRRRDIPGWYELDWASVQRSRARYVPLDDPKIVVDAVDDLAVNLERVLEHIAAAAAVGGG